LRLSEPNVSYIHDGEKLRINHVGETVKMRSGTNKY